MPARVTESVQSLVARSHLARRMVRRLSASTRRGAFPIIDGPARGLLIDVAGSRPSYVLGTAEPEMQRCLQEHVRPGDVVLDLGANVGFFTLISAALVGSSGQVIAYEPVPTVAGALRHNVALNGLDNVHVVEAAVSDGAGQAQIATNASDQEASLVNRRGGTTLDVRTVSVDDEVARLSVQPAFVKIDVEGAEDAVVRGMIRTLRVARPVVVCELHSFHHDLNGPIPATLIEAGYDVSWLETDVEGAEERWAPHLVAVPRPSAGSTPGSPTTAADD